jgi:hypothetical protein
MGTPPTIRLSSSVSRVCARDVGRDGAFLAQQRVQQRRLADIRSPDDGDSRPLAQDASRPRALQQRVQPLEQVLEVGDERMGV